MMGSSKFVFALGLAAAKYVNAGPFFGFDTPYFATESPVQSRSLEIRAGGVTPDNTCGLLFAGNGTGYTCDPNNVYGGQCCSASGYCGNTDAYCGVGCQKDFGFCQGSDLLPRSSSTCGAGVAMCTSGLCCSGSGYCGNTTDYCLPKNGCQSGFGDCSVDPATAQVNVPVQQTCGPAFGNATCNNGNCCSAAGYCGQGKAWCADPDCQPLFGVCDSTTTPAGASTANDPRPKLGSVTYADEVMDCTLPGVVGLTFDDGPYLYTSQLLDILKSYGFTATFFLTGNNLGKGAIDTTAPYPSIIKRMVTEGHQIASHSWSHYDLSAISSSARKLQMTKNERAIANIIGKYPTYMRPPYSSCTVASGCAKDIMDLGYHRIELDLDSTDYLNPSPGQIQNAKDVIKAALTTTDPTINDYLSIQHDIIEQSVSNLTSYFMGLIKARGWRGVTVGECLQDPVANWYRIPVGDLQSNSTASTALSSASVASTASSVAPVVSSASFACSPSLSTTAGSFPSTTAAGSVPSSTVGLPSSSTTAAGSVPSSTVAISVPGTTAGSAPSSVSAPSSATSAGSFPSSVSSIFSSSASSTFGSSSSSIASSVFTSASSTPVAVTSASSIPIVTATVTTPTQTTTFPSKTQVTIRPPAPTSSCSAQIGGFCFKLQPFGSKFGCLRSQVDCYQQSLVCPEVAGRRGWNQFRCQLLRGYCLRLTKYCLTCGLNGRPCDSSRANWCF